MCMLCVIQKWSRRVAAMLPWLVIPLIGLWALSQALPPAFRFEITSPRLACVFVLLVTLFWYEILMPWLSAWRAKRNAMLREKKRVEAIEMQKLRKTATKRCRNCFTPYRDQNPGGGKFMCSYCGHISKRPVLDLPVPQGFDLSNSRILNDLVGKSGKILKGKVRSDSGWICGQDWLENRNWVGGSFQGRSSDWGKKGTGFFVEDHYLPENSCSRVLLFVVKAFAALFMSIMWLYKKIFRIGSSRDDTSTDAEQRGMLDKKGEDGGNFQERKGERARRKAEEKRLARLEKELLEEEERIQREEVARLVEERRRLRDDRMEGEKERGKGPSIKERGSKKAGKKRQEKKKERGRGSSKSNSDAEELEKGPSKECEQNRRSETDQHELHRTRPEFAKAQNADAGHSPKGTNTSNHNHGNAGNHYLDRMRGSFFSSSRTFTGGGFLGKSTNTSNIIKERKSNMSVNHTETFAHRRELPQPDYMSGKATVNVGDTNINRHVFIEPQPSIAPKKSWQQLFTRSSAVSPPSNSNVISRPGGKPETEAQSVQCTNNTPSVQAFYNPFNFGLPSPFTLSSFSFGPKNSNASLPLSSEGLLPQNGEPRSPLLPEESEIFEDPCYVPDPVSLLGPVSESLDNFQLDRGFVADMEPEKMPATKNMNSSSEVSRTLRVSEERHGSSFLSPNTCVVQDLLNVPTDALRIANDAGTWQMWNSSPLGQDGLGLIGGILNQKVNREDLVHYAPQKTMASLFKNDDQVHGTPSLPAFTGSRQSFSTFGTSMPGSKDGRFSSSLFGTFSGGENWHSLTPNEEVLQNDMIYGSHSVCHTNQPLELYSANSSANEGWTLPALHGNGSGAGSSPARSSFLEAHRQDPLLVASTPPQMYSLFGHTTEKIKK
ncbi:uncharacterized protein LOC115998905 [Ipomoea triloba]|uniref:uncharacterized protein LOC115998905 n=1 Tax=Ipomoea triloba TaxID=35885 RepID=UPI00125DC7FD|nr:uncharacterized protein LOC115998905 [Ipomoea triloba]